MTLIKNHLARLLLFPSLLCLDAPFIALGWVFCLAGDLDGPAREMFLPVTAALFLSLWLIYLFDRLYDVARSDPGLPLSQRHEWARGHRALLSGWFVAALLTFLLAVLPKLEVQTIVRGLALGLLTGLYYLVFRFSKLYVRWRGSVPVKEGAIALCFTGGILLAASPKEFSLVLIPLVAGYVSLFFANCLLIGRAERGIDHLGDPAAYFSGDLALPGGGPVSRLPEWGALFAAVCGAVTLLLEGGWIRSSFSLILCGLLTFLLTRRDAETDHLTQPLADGIQLFPWLVFTGKEVWDLAFT